MTTKELSALIEGLRGGNTRAVSKLITLVERESPLVPDIYREIYRQGGHAHVVGICGPPGTGKSTLVNGLITLLRNRSLKVGVIAVDPTSPYTGGAVLGDRIRMQRHATDEMVLIRSMGTRGHLGGLSRATLGAVRLLDACGKDVVIVETVGIGQAEVEIGDTADTTVLVMAPGLGDQIQVLKAGIMEVGDIFVVNKADQGNADKLILEIQVMLGLNRDPQTTHAWEPPVIRAEGIYDKGIEEIWTAVERHRSHLQVDGALQEKRKQIMVRETMDIVSRRIEELLLAKVLKGKPKDDLANKIGGMNVDPYSAAASIVGELGLQLGNGNADP